MSIEEVFEKIKEIFVRYGIQRRDFYSNGVDPSIINFSKFSIAFDAPNKNSTINKIIETEFKLAFGKPEWNEPLLNPNGYTSSIGEKYSHHLLLEKNI